MAKFNKTEDYTFAKLCSTFNSFEVPNFQRPYAWKNKNLQDFWSSILDNEENYFIGNIVAVDGEPLKIIDGQQRLTTISLLLCAIRDSYAELAVKNAIDKQLVKQRIEEINLYLLWDDLKNVPKKTYKRLKLGKDIYQNVFELIVDCNTDKIDVKKMGDNEKRIFNNYKILKTLVKKYIKNSEISRLDEVKNKVLKLQVIIIACDSDNDIYGIFEGFNSTGLGLSVADLVKNALLRASSNNKKYQESIELQWGELEEIFEETAASRFPKFLRYQWISENGYVSMSNLYNEIKTRKIKSNNSIERYVNSIYNDGKIYIAMIYDRKNNLLDAPQKVKNEIFAFRYLRNDQVYEILLSWYRLYKKKKFKEKFFIDNLKKLWIFTVRAKFVSINPSDYEKIFSSHCGNIMDADNPKKEVKFLFDKLKPLVDNKEQFIENLLSDVKYGRDNKIIYKIYADLMRIDDPEIKQSEPEIEHILPQSPEKWGFAKAEVRDYVDKIGNLTLLFGKYNREMKNEIMSKKNQIFNKSKFKLNREIYSKWSHKFENDYKNAISNRGKEIAMAIEKIWQL